MYLLPCLSVLMFLVVCDSISEGEDAAAMCYQNWGQNWGQNKGEE